MTDERQPIKRLIYGESLLRTSTVETFARLAGFGLGSEELGKARAALSRCLSRALYEPMPEEIRQGRNLKGTRESWSFTYRGQLYCVRVVREEAVGVVKVLPGGDL